MAKTVTLQEVVDWVDKNKHRTWNIPKSFGKEFKQRTFEIKYLEPILDTRDMSVYRITGEGLGEHFSVDFREEYKGSILDLLEKKLNDARKSRKKT